MKRLISIIKNELLTGLLLLAPIGGAAYLVIWLVTTLDGLIPESLWQHKVIPGLGLLTVLVLALLVGVAAHNYVGRRAVAMFDSLAQRVPLFGSTYGLIKQVLEAVFSTNGNSFNRAVLVQYPVAGSWAIGFVTQATVVGKLHEAAGADVLSVYVPTTPNPTSGFYLLVERDLVRDLEMTVEQAFKLVLTMGIADSEAVLTTTAKWTRPPVEADSGK